MERKNVLAKGLKRNLNLGDSKYTQEIPLEEKNRVTSR